MCVKGEIRSLILGLGADVCGFAEAWRFDGAPEGFHPADVFPAFRTAIIFGVALPEGLFFVPPRLVYGHFNEMSCPRVDAIAFEAARAVERHAGCRAVPMPADSPYEYWDSGATEGRGLISMKHAAVLAGLGTLGKSALLLNEKYGNRLTLGAVLTDLMLPGDPPAERVCIEGCEKCIQNCPTQALAAGRVNQKLCRPHAYGKNARGFDTVDCNICRTVCPVRSGAAAAR